MGIIKRGVLGGFSNKIANVVGSSWKGIAYMRALPLSVANPRTVGQVAQRTKFGTISSLGSKFVGSWIQPLWNRFAVQASGFNDFVKTNIVWVDDVGGIDYAELQMSKGKLLGVENPSVTGLVTVAGNLRVDVAWDDNSGDGNALASDQVYVIAVTATTQDVSAVGITFRNSGSTSVLFQGVPDGLQDMNVYFAARREDGTIVSNSVRVLEPLP